MSIKEQMQADLKVAMRAKDKKQSEALRLLLSSILQKEVDTQKTLTEGDIISILEKEVKLRKASIEMFKLGTRPDLQEIEEFELGVISKYMPEALSESAVIALVLKAIQETGATTIKDMGKVMALVKPLLAGKADMSAVSALIKKNLG